MRMFTAVLPPDDVVAGLDEFLESRREHTRQEQGPLRWTSPEAWHITLGFMANVPEHRLDELTERLARAGTRRRHFDLGIGGGGAFPDAASARLVYAGVVGAGEDEEELRRLATGARAAVTKAGVPVDGARFRPHLTLARLRRPTDVVRWLRLLDTYQSRRWPVSEFALVRSHLGEGPRGRPRYETMAVFPLGRVGDPLSESG